jgi:MFS family permease
MRAWIIWLLGTLFMFFKYAIEVSPSIMSPDLMREFALTGTEMGHFAACYFYAYLILQIPAGLMIDRWGSRKVATIAILICSVGLFLFAESNAFSSACFGRFLIGMGAAFAAVNCVNLIANWFPSKNYALMMGLMMTLAMLGAVGGHEPLSQFISHLGWRKAIDIFAWASIVLAVVFFIVVRNRAPGHRKVDLQPPALGTWKNLVKVLSQRQSWYISLYSGFAFAPVSAFGGLWGVSFLTQGLGFPSDLAVRAASLIFVGFAFGAPLFGWYSDKIGERRHVMFWGTLTAMVSLAILLYWPGVTVYLAMVCLFIFGFSISSFLVCFSMIKEIHPVSIVGTSFGFMNAFDALFGAYSDPLTGKILDLFWTGETANGIRVFSITAYQWALSILMVYLILALILIKPIRETYCKQYVSPGMP